MCYRQSGGHSLLGVLGLLGTLALMVSSLTSRWYDHKGLWENVRADDSKVANQTTVLANSQVRGAQKFLAGISFVMAAASFCICLVVLFCLKPQQYSQNTRQTPKPGSLLLAVLLPTGFFFSVAWSIYTWRHWEEIQSDWTGLGYSYWLGAAAWTSLLVLLPIMSLADECAALADHKPLLV